MASENPTGRGSAVALTITADQVRFLRSVFRMAQEVASHKPGELTRA
jgi:hypothetical protein